MSSDEQIVIEETENLFKINKGMWVFIFIDFFIFAGMMSYFYSSGVDYPKEFAFGRSQLLLSFGFLNTIVFITSALTINLSKVALFNKNNFLAIVFVFLTFTLGMIFISVRFIDCFYLYSNGYLPASDSFSELSKGLHSFFATYTLIYAFFMLHVAVGIILQILLLIDLIKEKKERFIKLNFSVVYWSYLSLVWIFIFPILFLI